MSRGPIGSWPRSDGSTVGDCGPFCLSGVRLHGTGDRYRVVAVSSSEVKRTVGPFPVTNQRSDRALACGECNGSGRADPRSLDHA